MATYTDQKSNFTFNNYKTVGIELGQIPLKSPAQGPIDGIGGIINVVDIDWNGAQLSLPEELNLGTTITINTTGQLLAAIKVA